MAPHFIQNLIPCRDAHTHSRPLLSVLSSLTWIQWAMLFSGCFAWSCDAIDFFSVSLSITSLTKQFNQPTHAITTAITLTLIFRSVGAVIFGILSDRYGRKWPLVCSLILIASLEIGVSFVETFPQFLALRSLFGVGMGGVWGLASATALENLPVEARGIASGFLQQGYAAGYLIAAVANLFLVPKVSAGWRSLFWLSCGVSLSAAVLRSLLPESEVFLRAKEAEMARGVDRNNRSKVFIQETKAILKKHWMLCIYAVLLMTGFNILAHGSQDLYPTYLMDTKGFTARNATVATINGNCGAITGGIIAGWLSQYLGRRLTIILFILLIGAFIPLWILPSSFIGLTAGAFCIQFGVQGAWGVIPIQLAELSPPAFRATFPGVAYQLGSMISSASAQIEAIGGDNLVTTIIKNGQPATVPNYGAVQGILVGTVAIFVVIITIIGPERHGSHFEKSKTAFEQGGGEADLDALTQEETPSMNNSTFDGEKEYVSEKECA